MSCATGVSLCCQITLCLGHKHHLSVSKSVNRHDLVTLYFIGSKLIEFITFSHRKVMLAFSFIIIIIIIIIYSSEFFTLALADGLLVEL